MYILSQILIALSYLFCIISMLNKKKKNIIFYLIISTTLFILHCICLGGWTGAVIDFLEMVFLIIMFILEKKEKVQYSVYVSIITMILSVILSILTWQSWISLLPMIGLIFYLTAMMFKNVIIVKTGTFVRVTLNGVYMLLITSYLGAVLTIFMMVFTIYGIAKDIKLQKEKPKKQFLKQKNKHFI